MIMQRIQAIAQLSNVSWSGPARLHALFDAMDDAGISLEEILGCRHRDLVHRLGLTPEQAAHVENAAEDARRVAERFPVDYLSVLLRSDAAWPRRARRPSPTPMTPWLFVLGDPAVLDVPAVGIGGSRDATPRSLAITRNVAHRLAGQGVTVVSGGARGVDMAAHRAALAAGGATVVVLAQGLGTYQVPDSWWIPIREGRLTIISEFGPVDPWEAFRALQRNGTIVRLSDAFLVVQAEAKSGTYSAGRSALKMRRPLFVVSQTGSRAETFSGSEALLRDGAEPFSVSGDGTIPAELLDELIASEAPASEPPDQLRMF